MTPQTVASIALSSSPSAIVPSLLTLNAQSRKAPRNGAKPPRFTQQVHKKGATNKQKKISTKSNSMRRAPPQPNAPWQSGKSIDDLESTMNQRWGTFSERKESNNQKSKGNRRGRPLASNTKAQSPIDEDEDWLYMEGDEQDLGFIAENTARRPVLDPWQKQELRAQNRKRQQQRKKQPEQWTGSTTKSRESNILPLETDFYDEDDEGYEYTQSPAARKAIANGNQNRIDVAHMIAPRPAGGRGTNERDNYYSDDDEEAGTFDDDSVGYFFNRNVIKDNENSKTNQESSQRLDKQESSRARKHGTENGRKVSNTPKPPKRVAPLPAKPLLDENGQTMFLTVEQAMKTFQRSAEALEASSSAHDREDDLNRVISNRMIELPIVAATSGELSWSDLGITSTILSENLDNMYCSTPLEVQDKTCPPILTGQDVLVGTYTGSGKTLAFLTPLVQRLLWNREPSKVLDESENDVGLPMSRGPTKGLSILIVAPGRELASQITSVARELLVDTGLKVQMAIGGTTFQRNLEQIRKNKPNILVGTPGRIAELVVGKPGEK